MNTEFVPILKNCPFCGHEMFEYNFDGNPENDLIDILYPTGWYHLLNGVTYQKVGHQQPFTITVYTAHCRESAGGCGAEVSGNGREDTIEKWNRRT